MNWFSKSLLALLFWGALMACPLLAEDSWKYPASDVFWGPDEYAQFQNAFYQAHLALPHRRAAEPRKLFERLVDWNNVEHILEDAADPAVQERRLRIVLAAMGAIRADYNISVRAGEPLQEELTQVQIFDLKLSGLVTHLANPSLAAAGDTIAARNRFLGVIHSIAESDIYSERQIAALGTAAAQWFENFRPLFSSSERNRLYMSVSAAEHTIRTNTAKKALNRLLAVIEPH